MYCLSCGRELEEGYIFCDNCGAPVPKMKETFSPENSKAETEHYFEPYAASTEAEAYGDTVDSQKSGIIRCRHCGALIDDDSVFCEMCRARVAEEDKNPPKAKLCPKCGTEPREGDVFCDHCGYRLR